MAEAAANRGQGSAKRVAVIGAGPIGLEAALAATHAGFDVQVYEAGKVAAHVRDWGHVTLFTPFGMNRSEAGASAMDAETSHHRLPHDHARLTGREYVARYLEPLAQTARLRPRIHTGHRVVAVSRKGMLKGEHLARPARAAQPFRLLVETGAGRECAVEADAVIDASGVYGQPNHLGDGGIYAVGERAAGHLVHYRIDDVTGAEKGLYAGRRTALIGAGYSAATAIVGLRELMDTHPNTEVVWITRAASARPVHEIAQDRLADRQALARRANTIAQETHPRLRHVRGTYIERVDRTDRGTVVLHTRNRTGRGGRFEVDRVLAQVGYRPDRSLYEELQVHECYATQGPMKLAARLLQAETADCLDRTPAPSDTLRNPEPDFFIIGAKSYGRDSTFLLQTGLAQIQQVISLLHSSAQPAVPDLAGTH